MYINTIELIKGDCIEEMQKLIDRGVKVDMVLTDPPFGTTKNKWDKVISFDLIWFLLPKLTSANTPILLFGNEPFSSLLRLSNIDMYKYDWIWEKTTVTGHLNAKKMPLKCYENICVFYDKPPLYNPQITEGHKRKVSMASHKKNCKKTSNYSSHGLTSYDSTSRYPRNVLKFKTDKQKSAFHPTQKPVALLEYLIKTYTNEGDTVLDFTMGSGSTGVACKNLGRNFIGIEKDDKYFEIAKERILL